MKCEKCGEEVGVSYRDVTFPENEELCDKCFVRENPGSKLIKMESVFKVVESEIPSGKIVSISFPDHSYEKRIEYYGRDNIPVTIEFDNGNKHVILCGKTLIVGERR